MVLRVFLTFLCYNYLILYEDELSYNNALGLTLELNELS